MCYEVYTIKDIFYVFVCLFIFCLFAVLLLFVYLFVRRYVIAIRVFYKSVFYKIDFLSSIKQYLPFCLFVFAEVERIVTPETSYENLVSQQCNEIEEAMMNEVQRFYIAWNKKLDELKRRNGQMSTSDVNVMGMGGDSRGF